MTARARFRQAHGPGATAKVPGVPLPIIDPVVRAQTTNTAEGSELLIEPTIHYRGLVPMVYTGTLAIPYHAADGTVGVAALEVPPPSPWRPDDVKAMIDAARALRLSRAGTSPLTAPNAVVAREVDPGTVDWTEVNTAAGTCTRLLARWPTARASDIVWRPVELPHGRELEAVTARANDRRTRPAVTSGGRLIPTRTARRSPTVMPVRNQALSSIAQALVSVIHSHLDYTIHQEMRATIAPVEQVAMSARSMGGTTDPPPSTWPEPILASYVACSRALTRVVAQSLGTQHAPLADLWWLYETWVTHRILTVLTNLLGPPISTATSPTVLAAWEDATERIELVRQLRIGGDGTPANSDSLLSVTFELQPDLVLSVRRERVAHVVIDPKHRGRLDAPTMNAEASKYLWSIRSQDDSSAPAVVRVVLVAPEGGPDTLHPDMARMSSVAAFPNRFPIADANGLADELTPAKVGEWLEIARQAAASP